MANHVSAKKRIRRNARMEIVNKVRKNRDWESMKGRAVVWK